MTNHTATTCESAHYSCQDRSERTRRRLIEVAVERFSELGYAAASTRAIVKQADTNLVSIPYYFGNKLGLYHAAAEHIGSKLAERFRPACERASQALSQQGQTREQILQSFTDFIVELAEIMWAGDTPRFWGQFIYREQIDPTAAFEILHLKFLPLYRLGCKYVSRLTDQPADASETRIQFMSILAMLEFSSAARASVLRNTGWESIGEEEIRLITGVLRRNMQALFKPGEIASADCGVMI